MPRRLIVIAAAVLTLGLSGCDPDFCKQNAEDAESRVVRYEWDLDALGAATGFEVDAGDEPVTEQRIFDTIVLSPRTREIRLQVTDQGGNTAIASRTVTINPASGLVAAWSATPPAPFVGMTVTFDGSASPGAFSFSWDLDGDGTFEIPASTQPTVTHVYQTPGGRLVTLRVRDVLGHEAELRKAINVRAARAVASARRGFAALTRVRLPATLPAPQVRNGVSTVRGLKVRGRLVAPRRRLGELRPFRRARWVARLTLSEGRLRGVALARFGRGHGRACLRIAMHTRARGRPAGRVRLLGGSGDAARLRGGGRFRFAFRGESPRLDGRLEATLGRARPLPPSCSCTPACARRGSSRWLTSRRWRRTG